MSKKYKWDGNKEKMTQEFGSRRIETLDDDERDAILAFAGDEEQFKFFRRHGGHLSVRRFLEYVDNPGGFTW